MEQTWEELKLKKEVGKCRNCGKQIWVYWHFSKKRMSLCGPCHAKNIINETKGGD